MCFKRLCIYSRTTNFFPSFLLPRSSIFPIHSLSLFPAYQRSNGWIYPFLGHTNALRACTRFASRIHNEFENDDDDGCCKFLTTWTMTVMGRAMVFHCGSCNKTCSINGDVVSYVNISNVGQEDAGVYRCEARNEGGSVFHSEEIFVSGPPFIKPIGNISVLAGKSVAIRCPVTGYPIQRISWLKGMCICVLVVV